MMTAKERHKRKLTEYIGNPKIISQPGNQWLSGCAKLAGKHFTVILPRTN